MTQTPKVLAFDTSGPFVAIATKHASYSGGVWQDMARGQAEALMPLLDDTLADAGWGWRDVDVLGVGVGPGNFTGIRIAVAAARGLGLALKIPVFGLTAFELASRHLKPQSNALISLRAPRDMAYVQGYDPNGAPVFGMGRIIDPAHPPSDLHIARNMTVEGYRAREITERLGLETDPEGQERIAAVLGDVSAANTPENGPQRAARMAELTAIKFSEATQPPPPPAPNYIKPADAAPARDAPPQILP
ncbi:MAG: tRNA (adenosine(37)-N6)-threonylcarbamoyltransferase complex dimerization subunit type 1 TsaB [Pseudomonadota bacterium]